MHFSPGIPAGEAMTQLVDRDNDGAGQPQPPDPLSPL